MNKKNKIYPLYILSTIGLTIATSLISYSILDNKVKNENEMITINNISIGLNDSEKVKLPTKEELKAIEVNEFLNEYDSTITFYSSTFKIEKEDLITLIKNANINDNEFDNYDVFSTGTPTNTVDESIINYLLNLNTTNKALFNNKITPCNRSKEYITGLIDYFTSIYPSVDSSTAKAIAQIESLYSSSYMMSVNNIYGGMGSNGLLKYKNIEYGVLSYIKYLNDNYYVKGLTTISQIGYKYNPIVNESGVKMANPSWVTNVTSARSNYLSKDINTLDELLAIE
jgi:hypothetical protein